MDRRASSAPGNRGPVDTVLGNRRFKSEGIIGPLTCIDQLPAAFGDWPPRALLVPGIGNDDLQTVDDPYLPTDSSAFNTARVPTINLFSGSHEDYHRPTDRPSGIAYEELDPAGVRDFFDGLDLRSFGPPVPRDDPRFGEPTGDSVSGAVYIPESGFITDPQLSCHNVQLACEALPAPVGRLEDPELRDDATRGIWSAKSPNARGKLPAS